MTQTDREFPTMHLAMISNNGTVWDISLIEKTSPSRKYLFELPQSCCYHGYSDDRGILYFIDGYLFKVTQFHLAFNKHGHKNVAKLKTHTIDNIIYEFRNNDMCYMQSLNFGNNFWMFGAALIGDVHFAYSTFHE